MAIFRAFALVALVAASAAAGDYAAPANEKSTRASLETILSLSDEDYRDAVVSSKDPSVRDSTRGAMLGRVFRSLAAARQKKASELDSALTTVGRTVGDDQKSAGIDSDLVQETGWWADASSAVNQAMNQRYQVRGVTAIAGVRGGRKLSAESDKEITRLLDAVDAGDAALTDASLTPTKAAQIHMDAGQTYGRIAALVGAAPAPAPVAVNYAAPSGEKALRASAETALALSDEDYRDAVASSKVQSVRETPKGATLARVFKTLAAPRRKKAGELDPTTLAGRTTGDDAKSAGIDPELLQQTGWWGSVNAWAESNRYHYRGPTAVAAVRGGRKLSAESDKEIIRLLDAVDEGDKALADAATTPAKAAQVHLEAARAYEKISGLVAVESAPAPVAAAPVPAAPAAPAALSAKELYQKASPSVVLIMAADSGGAGELGTGSAIDAQGRVLTNAHVVINDKTGRPFGTIRVYLKPAKVTGDTKRDVRDPVAATVSRYDRALDLAILEPERPLGVAALALGDDSAVEPGDPVIAIGHPEQGGLWTLTQGVVSASIADLGGVAGKNAFQTDASINRGNSGGPLIDRTGAIVGVNTSMARKAADGLTITSVNFSVRASVAKRFIGGEAAPVAAAPATAPVASTPAPAAPVVALPPAPKTKPQILTPAQPYRIEDAIEEGMKEMEDLEDEMKAEIEVRRRALQQKQTAER